MARILIPIPTSFDEPYNTQCWPEYAAAVREAGGEPIQLPLTHTAAEIRDLVGDADGILLPGSGADVSPTRYGHEVDPASAEPDPLREETDRALISEAAERRIPLLGICLGLQSLNVYQGGTLVQDLLPVPVNHRAGRKVAAAHAAIIAAESRLGRWIAGASDVAVQPDGSLRLMVNSSHHQGAAIAGEGLRVAARCPEDAAIEALEGDETCPWLLAVQWHPERNTSTSDASRALFRSFIAEANRHAAAD